ncbi:MAG: 50S ribosomal protein L18a [Candidatus Diapherotrites archaeon]|nr:50S ribosomal protein L18a [Candidatus Diapherotrites archaeon]
MKFIVSGEFIDSNKKKTFTKEIEVSHKEMVEETILSVLGSKHKIKRRAIKIKSIKEAKAEERK